MGENRQVGNFQGAAALWFGTPQTYVNLHPAGYNASGAGAVRGNMQVGVVTLPLNVYHAALWRGTPASFVDLHPSGAIRSYCLATDGVLQGGYSDWSNGSHPSIWNGTAQSWIDLTFMGHTGRVSGMAPGVQVGEAEYVGSVRAALWRGSAPSYEDFSPPGTTLSMFYATTARVHVGKLAVDGLTRAAINFGRPSAWLNLHQFLPSQYTSFSGASAVYQNGPTIYVGGYAESGNRHAILWIGPDPCYPNCDQSTGAPSLTANDFMCFLNYFAARDGYANCDQSTGTPALTANDFQCFINRYAAGCS